MLRRFRVTAIMVGAALTVFCQVPSLAVAATQCFSVEGESYCLAWSAHDPSVAKSEFLRAHETVDHWQRMVTIIRYNDLSSIQQVIPRYLSVVRPYLGSNATPQWVAPKHSVHAEAAATRLVLSTPDNSDSEYVVAYFFSDRAKPAYAIIFSQHIPLPSGETPTMTQYGKWLNDLQAIRP